MRTLTLAAALLILSACGATETNPAAAAASHDAAAYDSAGGALARSGAESVAFLLQRSAPKREALLAAAGIPHHQNGVVSVAPALGEDAPGYVVQLWARCVPRIEPCLEAFDFEVSATFLTDGSGDLIRLHAETADDLKVLLSFPNVIVDRLRAALALHANELFTVKDVALTPDGLFAVEVTAAGSSAPARVTFDRTLEIVAQAGDVE